MPLSRHFYSLDEVHAALSYSTTRNDRQETAFWCHELLLSGCISETISTLWEAWLFHKGPFCLSWLLHAWSTLGRDEIVEQDILLSADQLSSIPYQRRDHSLWHILSLSAGSHPPDRVTPKTPSLPSSDPNEIYFVRALYQGKGYSAWWMAQHLSTVRVWVLLAWYTETHSAYAAEYKTIWEALQGYEQLLGYRSEEYDTIILCAAVLSACLSPAQQDMSFQTLSNKPVIRDLSTVGRMAHRRYAIPSACLYGHTKRGRSTWSTSTMNQLNRLDLLGCPFWEEALAPYATCGIRIQWNSDDAKEAFYDRYLLDDVPDEWTKAEKQKSHGDGLLGPSESVTLVKYTRLFLSHTPRLAWNTTSTILRILEGRKENTPSCLSLPAVVPALIPNTISLDPVRRIRII